MTIFLESTTMLSVVLLVCLLGAQPSHAAYDVCPSGPRFANGLYDHFWMMCSQIYSKDANSDHVVTLDEHLKALASFGMTDERKVVYFLTNDMNGDGVIDAKDDPIVFSRADTNHDTVVTWTESDAFDSVQDRDIPFMTLFLRVRGRLNVTSLTLEQYKELFSPLNATAVDGSISKEEFRKSWFNELGGIWQEFENVFLNLDFNKDDIISKSELAKQFPYVDENKNGGIEYQEVYRIQGPYPNTITASTK